MADPTAPLVPTAPPVRVLLVDDQAIVGEAVRRMLAPEADISFTFCPDPAKAIEAANALGPTVILQDLVMPEIDGLTLVKFFRANEKTRDVPMIVLSTKEEATIKAQAFGLGANDYLVKLPDRIELVARIRYHSRAYTHLLERNEAYRKLEESQQALAAEVNEAARYVVSLLPAPWPAGPAIDWRFTPSTELGGDSFGYHWLDDDHLAVFLLDVSGHGVGASLLSVSAMNVLTGHSLPNTDFKDPSQVMKALASAFPMEKHNGKYFTIWYGVLQKSTRRLAYCGGGHPPALLFTGPDASAAPMQKLKSRGPFIGLMTDFEYETQFTDMGSYARLFLFSDGAYEVSRTDGEMWTVNQMADYVAGRATTDPQTMDALMAHIRAMHGQETLEDDCSMVMVTF